MAQEQKWLYADLIECLWLLIKWQGKRDGKLGKHLLSFFVIMAVEIQSLEQKSYSCFYIGQYDS